MAGVLISESELLVACCYGWIGGMGFVEVESGRLRYCIDDPIGNASISYCNG